MPYNNTPIAPTKQVTGTANLPLARVKKILSADDDISACSNNAAFVITIAAELFIQYLAEQTHAVVKTERKQRRNFQYRDVAAAVARVDNLEFLADVVPRTTTVKKVKEARREKAGGAVGNGQMTLDGKKAVDGGEEEENGQDEREQNGEEDREEQEGRPGEDDVEMEDLDNSEVPKKAVDVEEEEQEVKGTRPRRGKGRKSG